MFIPENFSLEDNNNNNANELCRIIRLYVNNIRKTKEILVRNNAAETEFLSLSVFLNSSDGLDMEDEVYNQLRIPELVEED